MWLEFFARQVDNVNSVGNVYEGKGSDANLLCENVFEYLEWTDCIADEKYGVLRVCRYG